MSTRSLSWALFFFFLSPRNQSINKFNWSSNGILFIFHSSSRMTCDSAIKSSYILFHFDWHLPQFQGKFQFRIMHICIHWHSIMDAIFLHCCFCFSSVINRPSNDWWHSWWQEKCANFILNVPFGALGERETILALEEKEREINICVAAAESI